MKIIARNVDYIMNLVGNTLKLAELNSPSFTLVLKDLSLLNVVDNVIKDNQFVVKEKGITVENLINGEVFVEADEVQLMEVLDNLSSNAAKFMDKGDTLTFDAWETDNEGVTVAVRDTGCGMTQEQISHVFDEFYKTDVSRHDLDSNGLGLSICKRIVEEHGGKIWVESLGIGKGSTFYFTLKSSNK